MKGDKLGRQGGSGSQEQPRKKGNHEGTRRQRQPRAAQNRDHEERQAWETRRQRQEQPRKGDHEGGHAWGTGQQRPPRAAQKGNHEGVSQGGSRSQEPPRRMKGDKLRRQRDKLERRHGKQQPRAAQKGDHEGGQGAAAKSSPEWRSRKQTSLGDKAAATAMIFPPLPLPASFRPPPLASSEFQYHRMACKECAEGDCGRGAPDDELMFRPKQYVRLHELTFSTDLKSHCDVSLLHFRISYVFQNVSFAS